MKSMMSIQMVESIASYPGSYTVDDTIDEVWVADHPHCGEPYIITIRLYGIPVYRLHHPGWKDGFQFAFGFGEKINRTAEIVAKAAIGLRAYADTPKRETAEGTIERFMAKLNK